MTPRRQPKVRHSTGPDERDAMRAFLVAIGPTEPDAAARVRRRCTFVIPAVLGGRYWGRL
jgi:hypothetical protein